MRVVTATLTCGCCGDACDTLHDGVCGWCLAGAGRSPEDTHVRVSTIPTASREHDYHHRL